MRIIDTHAHLDFPDFREDLDEVVARAAEHGVDRIITIGIDVPSSRRAIELAERYEGVYAVVGIHPNHAHEAQDGWEEQIDELAAHPKVAAIGETGLDFYKLWRALGLSGPEEEPEPAAVEALQQKQAEVFEAQLRIAQKHKLNAVIHQRHAFAETSEQMKPYDGKVRGVFHCFVGTPDQAAELLNRDHLVSFTGILTFKNATDVQEVAAGLAPEQLMAETDCPYLAPHPHRGKRSEPWHTRLVIEKIADLHQVDVEVVAESSTATAEGFFRLDGA